MTRLMEYSCCKDFTIQQITACGRTFPVCVNCDNGINNCTEGYCQHEIKEMS